MLDVVVVGGGFAGIAAAVRIAKMRHRVILLEETETLGGQLVPSERGGYVFDEGYSELTLPATLRDLFKKSGRPLDRVLDLVPLDVARRHVLSDGTVLDLPTGSRGAQADAITAVLGARAAKRWTSWVDGWDDTWEVLRQNVLEPRFSGREALTRAQRRTLRSRRSLRGLARTHLRAAPLRDLVLDRFVLDGQPLAAVPAYAGVVDHVERTFGRWRIDGGTPALLDALSTRLGERRVDVRTGVRADDVLGTDPVVGVRTSDGEIRADVVVWAAPSGPGGRLETDLLPLVPSATTYLGLGPGVSTLAQELVVHGPAPVRVRPSHAHTGPGQAWTVEHGGLENPLDTLARAGVVTRGSVEVRVDLGPRARARRFGARYGWQDAGSSGLLRRPGVGAAPRGYLRVGVNAHPGPSTEQVALGAASAAEELRPVSASRPRRARRVPTRDEGR